MKRSELIKICEDAVVHHIKWRNRDSYCAQKSIQSIYKGLTAGLEYRIITQDMCSIFYSDEKTIVIEFLKPINFKKLETGKKLKISTREDYHKDCDPKYKTEMFEGEGIDFYSDYTQTYMPTRKRLNEVGIGNDWY